MQMKHYKDAAGNMYGFAADGSQDHLIGNKTPLSNEDKEILTASLQSKIWDQHDYYRKRIYSYPEIGEFLDAWVKGDDNAMNEYREKCLEVKRLYPKPEGF